MNFSHHKINWQLMVFNEFVSVKLKIALHVAGGTWNMELDTILRIAGLSLGDLTPHITSNHNSQEREDVKKVIAVLKGPST